MSRYFDIKLLMLVSTLVLPHSFTTCASADVLQAGERAKKSIPKYSGKVVSLTKRSTTTPVVQQSEGWDNLCLDPSIVLLDVRTPKEYVEGHIPGSLLVPLVEAEPFEKNITQTVSDKNKTVYLYCRGGVRSDIAGQMMRKFGYSNVYNLGGIVTWPFDLVK